MHRYSRNTARFEALKRKSKALFPLFKSHTRKDNLKLLGRPHYQQVAHGIQSSENNLDISYSCSLDMTIPLYGHKRFFPGNAACLILVFHRCLNSGRQ